ncbi:MAG: hypothetical protein ACR2N6_06890 [Miltoncostaeaceae bacterium]
MTIATRTRRTGLGAIAVAAAATAALAAAPMGAAQDDTVKLAGGETRLHLDAGTAAALGGAGVNVAPIGPATARGTRVTFPITGGAINPATAAGTINHSGGIRFSAGGTTVNLRNFIVNTNNAGLTAQVGGARARIIDLDTSKAKVIRRGSGGVDTWVVRVDANLSTTGARALNAAFNTKLFQRGTPIGRVDVRSTPAELLLRGGETTLQLSSTAAGALTTLGVAAGPVAPATAGSSGLAFPVSGGKVARVGFAGRIDHTGGIGLSAGATNVNLTDFQINVDNAPDLTGLVGGSRAPILNLDLSNSKTGVSQRNVVVTNVGASLTNPAAAALNGAFSVTAFAGGLDMGTARVQAKVR